MPVCSIRRAGEPQSARRLEAQEGALLGDVLRQARVDFAMPCGGKHTCGKCAVLARGSFSPVEAQEQALLDGARREKPPAGYAWRMACLCRVAGEGEILLPGAAGRVSVAQEDERRYAYDGAASDVLGIAVDIGTTTVSLSLYQLQAGELLASVHAMNRQTAFGADVLSRIAYSDANGILLPVESIRAQLLEMTADALAQAGGKATQVARMVVSGNTTMLHYLMGLDPKGIGVSPFMPESFFGETVDADRVLPAMGEASLYLPRAISAYVGPDISSGILAVELCAPGGTRLLVDVGTNGEMALYAGGRLLCCSTAAGPAFEGANIAMGMPALPGAVDAVSFADGHITRHTLGEAAAKGICGTGLISAVCGMLEAGVLDGSGRILESGHPYVAWVVQREGQRIFRLGDCGVYLSQEDIRNIQLAKAAIAAGIDTLLHEAGIGAGAVDALCLSGGFGSYINVREAAGMGLVPEALADCAVSGGNTSLRGAVEMLFSLEMREATSNIAMRAEEVQLSTHPYFMEQYIEHMAFFEE